MPSEAAKRYRYYVSRHPGHHADQSWRLPAGDLETMVETALRELLCDPLRLSSALDRIGVDPTIIGQASIWAERIRAPSTLRELLQHVKASIMITPDAVRIRLERRHLASILGNLESLSSDSSIEICLPAILRQRGHELRFVPLSPDARPANRDGRLIQLLASSRAAYDALLAGEGADRPSRRSHLVRLTRLAFLAPEIVVSILEGRQPVELTSRSLLRIADLPLLWSEQRRILGFACPEGSA